MAHNSNMIKYLGVYIDFKMTGHVKKTAKRMHGIINSLSRIMSKIGEPTASKRKLIANVAVSVML